MHLHLGGIFFGGGVLGHFSKLQ